MVSTSFKKLVAAAHLPELDSLVSGAGHKAGVVRQRGHGPYSAVMGILHAMDTLRSTQVIHFQTALLQEMEEEDRASTIMIEDITTFLKTAS